MFRLKFSDLKLSLLQIIAFICRFNPRIYAILIICTPGEGGGGGQKAEYRNPWYLSLH